MEMFENEFAIIQYDENMDAISLVFKKQTPTSDFISINKKLIEEFSKLNTYKFFVDARKMGVVGVEGQKWVADNLFKGMLLHLKGQHLIHAQLLPPEDVFAKTAGNNIKAKQQGNEKLIFQSFFALDEAIDWLKGQKITLWQKGDNLSKVLS